ncbi:MAG: Non-homologous end joining protein Ku [Acidimicrobiales bacterium]|nr:MAG: Ku protein [Actinomycetota bacterium]MBV6510102.1 Non-homologous end joining protein Ku [Acidimicrobiales bacterium]RIK03595.1 MAG: Ku protein [Acidobacteriota bacterium]
MPRAIWSGSISFGLVNIPVKLFTALSRKTVRFNQIDRKSGTRIRQKRVAGEDGHEVPSEDLAKGYEYTKGQYVIVDEDELAALDPEALRTIDIEEFVDLAEIDPLFYDNAYYLAPERAAKPYTLLARAMDNAGKVAIARFVMRSKQYLAAIRPKDGVLVLSTMVYADEITPTSEIPELEEAAAVEISEKELAMAEQLIETLEADFEHDRFHDTYREDLLALIDRKVAGEEILAPAVATPTAEKVVDLMAALEASVAEAKGARERHPSAGQGEGQEAPGQAQVRLTGT